MENNKKINSVEVGLVIAVVALAEILEFFLNFIPIVGWLFNFFINITVWLGVQFWLRIKGMKGMYFMISGLVDMIPIINALPTKTIALTITIKLYNKEKI